jgi:hypothetical protein
VGRLISVLEVTQHDCAITGELQELLFRSMHHQELIPEHLLGLELCCDLQHVRTIDISC